MFICSLKTRFKSGKQEKVLKINFQNGQRTQFLDFASAVLQWTLLEKSGPTGHMLRRYPTLSLLIHPGGWLRRDKVGWATGCAFSHFCESVPLSKARTLSSTSLSSVAGALSCSSKGKDEGGTVARINKGRLRNLCTDGKDTGLAVEGFVPKFYLLNAQNAESYANKNPNPAEVFRTFIYVDIHCKL